ncbi:MAG: hypothetical protein K0B81_07775 [Candidatus Cloacimonetes bacterium]|nr:hypothetical protein [Candidatus Cloacimonadota bacterium]
MKKFKFVLLVMFLFGLGYFAFKYLRKLLEFFKLVKTLPEYLRDIIGEKPTVNFTFSFSKCFIEVGLSQAVKEREKNLHEVIETYINDFYPDLSTVKIEISIVEKKDEKAKKGSD